MTNKLNPEWIVYKVVAGSFLYGLETPSSDIDVRGVYNIPLREYLCEEFPHKVVRNDKDYDELYMDIVAYLKLIFGGNPNVIDWLYTAAYTDKKFLPRQMREEFITKQMLSKSVAMGLSMIARCKKKKDKQWKMLSHAKRILYTVYNKALDPDKDYNPILEGVEKGMVMLIKNGDKSLDYWKLVAEVEQGLLSLYALIDGCDLPDKAPKEKLNELIIKYKIDESKSTK